MAAVRAQVGPALARARVDFPDLPREPFRIVVHRNADALPPALEVVHHEGSPGFALLGQHEIHILFDETNDTPSGPRAVLVHEIVHELLHQACEPFGARVPRWFHEGLAQLIAGDTYLGASEEMIVWRAATDQLLPFSQLEEAFPHRPLELRVAYAQSYSFVAWLDREIGRPKLLAMVRSIDAERSLDLAMVHATDRPTAQLFDAWRDHVLHGSGATWRSLLQQFFALSMILALPLLAMAMIRRQQADRAARARLERAESEAPVPMPEPDELPEDEFDDEQDDVDGWPEDEPDDDEGDDGCAPDGPRAGEHPAPTREGDDGADDREPRGPGHAQPS